MLQSMQEQLKAVQGIPAQLKSFNDRLGALEGERKETSIDLTSNGLNNRPRDQIQQPLPDLALHIERADKIRVWADEYFTEQIKHILNRSTTFREAVDIASRTTRDNYPTLLSELEIRTFQERLIMVGTELSQICSSHNTIYQLINLHEEIIIHMNTPNYTTRNDMDQLLYQITQHIITILDEMFAQGLNT